MGTSLELRHIAGESWYIPGPVNLGLYGPPEETVLIDSGNDESMGRKIFRLLEDSGRTLKTIVNTHSHADHIGGNQYLQKKTGCAIGSSPKEAVFVEDPSLEPTFLWGAAPFKRLQNKFLQAKPSRVTFLIDPLKENPDMALRPYALKGHTLQMVGFQSPDNVFYIGDTLFSKEIVEKYRLLFALDIRAFLQTLEELRTVEADFFVPCHAEPCRDIQELIHVTREGLLTLTGDVLQLCSSPRSRESILTGLFRHYDLAMNSSQYVLGWATVGACLTYLMEEGALKVFEEEREILWEKIT